MSLARDIPLLRQVPLLGEFSDEQLRLLAFSAENVVATPDEVIFREGERSDASYVIVSGKVALRTQAKGGKEGTGAANSPASGPARFWARWRCSSRRNGRTRPLRWNGRR